MSALAAEWVKFRTVRGWVVAVVIAAAVIAGLALSSGMHGTCTETRARCRRDRAARP